MALKTGLDPNPVRALRVSAALEATLPAISAPCGTDDAWDGLFAWGDQFRKATGITPADIDEAVSRVRSCKL